MQSGFSGLTKVAGAFIAALSVQKVMEFGNAVKNATAEFQRQQNQLKLITVGQEDLAKTTQRLREVAVANRTAFADTVDLYTKLTLATNELGVSSDQVVKVTSSLSRALQISGADAATTSSVIRQFGQAMASGTVRGDEFNSLVEGLGPALIIMSKETGISVGKLREMSRAGELTAEKLFEMLEASEALNKAFGQMDPTIDQLEQGLSDAFDAALIKLGEVTGFTEAYEKGILSLTNSLNVMAGTANHAGMSNAQLMEAMKNGTVDVATGVEELKRRYSELDNSVRIFGRDFDLDFNLAELLGLEADETVRAKIEIINYYKEIQEFNRVRQEQAKANEDAAKAEAELSKAIKEATAPFREFIKLAEKYETSGFGSALDRNEQKIKAVNEAMAQLKIASETVIEATGETVITSERYNELLGVLQLELAALTKRNKELRDAQAEVVETGRTYESFLEDVIKTMNESVQTDQFKQQAITTISARYRDGTYTLAQYEAAMKQLDSTFETANTRQQRETDDLMKKQEALRDSVQELAESYKTYFLDRIQQAEYATSKEIQTLKDAYVQGAIDLQEFNQHKLNAEMVLQDKIKQIRDKAAEEELKRQEAIINKNLSLFREGKFDEVDVSQLSEEQKKEYAIKSGREALDALAKHNKTAFNAMKALNIAEAIMNTYTGATKALASFPPPFNFIAAAAVVAAGLANVATIRAQTYTGRQRGGDLRSGQLSMVGEDGPEMIVPKQPSTVIPREVATAIEGMGGNGGPVTVNFNINTVDARGFDELLIERRGTITGIINNAMQQRGRVGVV